MHTITITMINGKTIRGSFVGFIGYYKMYYIINFLYTFDIPSYHTHMGGSTSVGVTTRKVGQRHL